MYHRTIYAICIVLTFFAQEAFAQRKGLISSDQLLKMALEETNKHHNYQKAITLCQKALAQSPDYTDVKLLLGRLYQRTGKPAAARIEWLEVLKKQPPDRDALQYLINLENSLGRGSEAVCYIDIALQHDPYNKELLLKKHGILQEHKQQEEADKVLALLTARYAADPKVRGLQEEKTQEMERAARLAAQPQEEPAARPDPKAVAREQLDKELAAARKKNNISAQPAIAQKILAMEPGNKDALLVVINSYVRLQRYDEALRWCDKALARSGRDEDLLRRKIGILQQLQRNDEAAATARQLLQINPTAHHQQIYRDVQLQRATAYTRSQNFAAGLGVIDTLLRITPADTMLLFKRSGLLEAVERYEEAAAVSKQLLKAAPSNPRYQQAYTDQLFAAARRQLSRNEPAKARPLLVEALQQAPADKEMWMALINLENTTGHTAKAISLCDSAMAAAGPDAELLQKKSALLQAANRLREACPVSEALVQQYPGNAAFQQMYADQLIAYGRQLQRLNAWDTALVVLKKAYQYQPADTLLLQQLVNNSLALQQYDSAVAYADKGLQLHPGDPVFLMKKATALEAVKDYRAAAATARALAQAQPDNKDIRNYHAWLQSKTYRNQAGVIHLQSIYDNGNRPANLTALQYFRFHKKGSIGGRVSYADRSGGSGIQLEAETYYTHSKKYYSYGILGWSGSEVFPRIRAGYSLFRNFGRDWEAELGARYLKTDSASNYAAVASVGKLWGQYWANLRGYVITEDGNWYQAYTLTNRFYLGEKKDFIAFTLSLGNTPDDRSRNFQFNKNASFLAGGAGLGFQKTFVYRTTLGLFGNWTYQRLTNDQHYNQYDIYLTLLHNF